MRLRARYDAVAARKDPESSIQFEAPTHIEADRTFDSPMSLTDERKYTSWIRLSISESGELSIMSRFPPSSQLAASKELFDPAENPTGLAEAEQMRTASYVEREA